MEKIILRHRKTGETRTVDKAKYLALAPDRQALYEVVAEPTTEQFTEAERLAGKGETGPSLLSSGLRGASAGITGEPPTTLMGAGAEALGAGLRDAGLAVALGRLAGPRAAVLAPTLSGAVEGAVSVEGGTAEERTVGALTGGIAASLPVPKIIQKAGKRVGSAIADMIGSRAEAKTQQALIAAQKAAGKQGAGNAEKIALLEAETAAEEALAAAIPRRKVGAAAGKALVEGTQADLVRQVPQQAVAAILADPRLEGRELSTIKPGEMWDALKRATELITDEDARVRELAIRLAPQQQAAQTQAAPSTRPATPTDEQLAGLPRDARQQLARGTLQVLGEYYNRTQDPAVVPDMQRLGRFAGGMR